jgi:GntR family transcriptional regulator/MocR family aminotransferase
MARPLSAPSTLDLGVDRHDREPIQQQIARQIRELVLSGRLAPQAKLPSTRSLAEELGVARATAVEAYEQLAGEGYIETRSGSGTRVAAVLPEVLLNAAPQLTARRAPPPPRLKREPARPFRTGLVDWNHFPHDDWGRSLGRFWRNPPIAVLEHHDPFGWLPLRAAIARHLYEWRGIAVVPEQVVITAGGLDAFDLIRRTILKPGDAIWLEDPGYATARRVFAQGGATVVPVATDGEGLVVARGRELAGHAKAAFVTPARQYPTGVTMPLSRRLELLDWAKAAQAMVIEDDYDSEFRYVGRPLPALMSLDTQGRVIYSGTFSKVFSPIIRLGFLAVPKALAPAFREGRLSHGAPPSLMVQPALADFIESGAFAIHIRRMRRIYAARRKALLAALAPDDGLLYHVDAAPSGLTLLLRLPPGVSDEAVAKRLKAAGIEALTLSSHYANPRRDHGLLLSFAGFDDQQLARAGQRLRDILSDN